MYYPETPRIRWVHIDTEVNLNDQLVRLHQRYILAWVSARSATGLPIGELMSASACDHIPYCGPVLASRFVLGSS